MGWRTKGEVMQLACVCEVCGEQAAVWIMDMEEKDPNEGPDGTLYRNLAPDGSHMFCADHARLPRVRQADGSVSDWEPPATHQGNGFAH